MSIIILLLGASLLLGVVFVMFFIRAVRSGQYDDTTTPAMRVLADDEAGAASAGPAPSRGRTLNRTEKERQT